MVPDEQPPAAPSQSDSPAGKGPRRRSRRGGRRHSRRREPRPPGSPLPPSADAIEAGPEGAQEPVEQADPPVEAGESAQPVEAPGQKLPPLRPAAVVRARDQQRTREPQAPREPQPPRQPLREESPERAPGPKIPSITKAIEQVNEIIAELKHALDEMDDVLETLELAERQKIDDEREIDNLQHALRRLNRPRDDDQRHH